ncbi:N-acetylmuramoyl-L-alanine amidase family protein [Peribacillus loiseleuriae]|uniref:N-acetylmuramoyl-L-alanine amidase family protein n=1 Tax=Peribacillus loiseleuriae TaxID=1679170 RepID=UPI003D03C5B5
MKKIKIDPGHGGKDPGGVANGLQEKNIVLDLSKEMKKYLDENYTDHETTFTRTTDVFIELSERANIANRTNVDVFISNHVNAGGGTGYESYIYTKPSVGSVKLQSLVNAEALATAKKYGLGAHGDDSKRGDLAVVRQTNMPALLTEIAYIDSKDADLLKNNNFIKDMAAAYARGVAKYLNLPAKQVVSNVVTDTKKYRLKTGVFPTAEALVEGKKRLSEKYNWLLHEVPESTNLNPGYRILTGTLTSKIVAEGYAEEIKKAFGWTVYIVED